MHSRTSATAIKEVWKGDDLTGLGKGSPVWIRLSGEQWCFGVLQSKSNGGVSVKTSFDPFLSPSKLEVATFDPDQVVPADTEVPEGSNDLTRLSYLNEPSILHHLEQRFQQGEIYTAAGSVLVAINPFKPVPLYSDRLVKQYACADDADYLKLSPHVFLTVSKAYKALCNNARHQSLVISGESGAGKTETAKIAMQYLAKMSGGAGIEEQVMATNPLLEAFGNAKTLRNSNSSRFGKLLDIHFDSGNQICGASLQTYLLEKSRVTCPLAGERSYHVFYQLCRGANAEQAQKYCLPRDGVGFFRYLLVSGCTTIPGLDDAKQFHHVCSAMNSIGLGQTGQDQIFSLLSAVLWLGNIKFSKPDDVVVIEADEALKNVAQLLGIAEISLVTALTTRALVVGTKAEEVVTKTLSLEQAHDTRDALAKAIYANLFSAIIAKVNTALAPGRDASAARLTILDIYGFESFKENAFEQLCINYANERLQQLFNRHLLKVEQDVYKTEGISWDHIDFEDNTSCLQLFEGVAQNPMSILSLLDEECMFPKGTDSTFGNKLRKMLKDQKDFGYTEQSSSGTNFYVDHFAGRVQYSCTNILDKNRDSLNSDLTDLLSFSQHKFVASLFDGSSAKKASRQFSTTVTARFKKQLRELVNRLERSGLHFIRCIKPNESASPNTFDTRVVLHQLRCCGLMEVTRLAKAGYPTRFSFQDFLQHFSLLLPRRREGNKQQLRHGLGADGIAADLIWDMLQNEGIEPTGFALGSSKSCDINTEPVEDALLQDALSEGSSGSSVSTVRRWRAVKVVQNMRMCQAASRIQQAWRHFCKRRAERLELIRQTEAAALLALQPDEQDGRTQEEENERRSAERRRQQLAMVCIGTKLETPLPATAGGSRVGSGVFKSSLSSSPHQTQQHQGQPVTWTSPGDSSSPSSIANRSRASLENAYTQIEGWESYCKKLETKLKTAEDDNRSLQQQLAELRTRLENNPTGRSSGWKLWKKTRQKLASKPSESHNDSIAAGRLTPSLVPKEDAPILKPITAGDNGGLHSISRTVQSLHQDFDQKERRLGDDVAFLTEVKQGISRATPDMDASLELQLLKQRFQSFKQSFKERLDLATKLCNKSDLQNSHWLERESG